MLETKDLQAFVAIAQTSSFTLAAEKLFLTQSALSKRLHRLEERLGQPLIDRKQRPWKLTHAGIHLLPIAKQSINQLTAIETHFRKEQITPSGTLDLAISHHLSLYRLPKIIKAFSLLYPNVHLNIAFLTSDEVHQSIRHKSCELGFATLKSRQPPQIEYQRLWLDNLVFVGSALEDWCTHPVDINILCQQPAVLPQINSLYFQMVNQLFLEHHCSIGEVFQANYLETVRSMVSAGLGWTVLPRAMLDNRLVLLTLNMHYNLQRSLGVLTRQRASLSLSARAFLNQVLQSCNDLNA